MTNEEAIKWIERFELAFPLPIEDYIDAKEALDMAIKALEQQPCEDCISRENLLNSIEEPMNWTDSEAEIQEQKDYENFVALVKSMPPVTPKAEWIPCSERLPASDEDVLVTNGRGMYIGWIDHADMIWRVDSESEYFMYDIIAWMPLPTKPYKAESEE